MWGADLQMTIIMDRAETPVLTGDGALKTPYRPRIVGVGTAASDTIYTQTEVLDAFGITDPKIRSVFVNSAIDTRHLTLPDPDADGVRNPEPQGDLLDKHKSMAVRMGVDALNACLKRASAPNSPTCATLCCVSSTGFLTPGLSALMIRELGIDRHCSRSDIVGMGCNAGLNALNVVSGWSAAHPANSPWCSAPRRAPPRTRWTPRCAPRSSTASSATAPAPSP
ncbi:Polyketide synthase OS=Streptomyces fumanus OX=67302 GN=GCM10018772_35910 PE=3 SV=1 [Streptomyces fumanus]